MKAIERRESLASFVVIPAKAGIQCALRVDAQRHWIPDIASRFRDDEQTIANCMPEMTRETK
jgi:hypothetical protein